MCARAGTERPHAKVWANPKDLSLEAYLKRGGGGGGGGGGYQKGSAKLLSWQHCASPFLHPWVRTWVKQKMQAALISL